MFPYMELINRQALEKKQAVTFATACSYVVRFLEVLQLRVHGDDGLRAHEGGGVGVALRHEGHGIDPDCVRMAFHNLLHRAEVERAHRAGRNASGQAARSPAPLIGSSRRGGGGELGTVFVFRPDNRG